MRPRTPGASESATDTVPRMANLPIFFPTRVLLVDDEPHVLRMTSLLFEQRPEVSSVLAFPDALAALDFLKQEQARLPALDAFAAARVHDEIEDDGRHPVVRRHVEIRLSDVAEVLDAPHRRDLVSVIVCDYAMPGMDGLEFFSGPIDAGIRRVLLTAICDEHRAVQAFNRGTIHQFVHKADAAGPRGLETVLVDQIEAFFRSRTSHLAAALALGPAGGLLEHPELAQLLRDVAASRGFVEYSFSAVPPGFRLGGSSGRARLLLADTGAFARTIRVVEEIEAPPSLAAALRARDVMPWDRDGRAIYEAGDAWSALAVPPQAAGVSEPLFWALIDDA